MSRKPLDFDAKAILAKIRENSDRLDSCERHHFTPPEKITFGMKYVCNNCGGKLDPGDVFQYMQGYAAAGGNPNDIMPKRGE